MSAAEGIDRPLDIAHQSLIALVFLASGSAKLLALEFEVEAFSRWGYPLWFMTSTGAAEVSGAVALWIRPLRALACLGLTVLMIGAVGTHVVHGEGVMAGVATLILLLTAARVWRLRGELRSPLRRG